MLYGLISDCNIVIVNYVETEFRNYLIKRNLQIVITHEKIITNAIVAYLNERHRMESNTCCSP